MTRRSVPFAWLKCVCVGVWYVCLRAVCGRCLALSHKKVGHTSQNVLAKLACVQALLLGYGPTVANSGGDRRRSGTFHLIKIGVATCGPPGGACPFTPYSPPCRSERAKLSKKLQLSLDVFMCTTKIPRRPLSAVNFFLRLPHFKPESSMPRLSLALVSSSPI